LVAAITALVLVLVLQGSGGGIPAGYNAYSAEEEVDGKWYYEALLQRTQNVTAPVRPDEDNEEFGTLRMKASMMNDNTIRLKINPVTSNSNSLNDAEDIKRWEIPTELLGNTKDDYGMRLNWANFDASTKPAGFEISNPNVKNQQYLSTKNRNFVFMDKYIELGFEIDSRKIFGFGERQKTFELNTGEYSSWANGRDNHMEKGEKGGHSYGDHPFVLARLNSGAFVGIFFANSNAKTLEYTHVGKNKSILNFRAIGGILDFYTFFADNPEDVIKAYHDVIGHAYFPPFWALGFHQSSWQYETQAMVEDVLKKYKDNKIPLEGMWLDIEYMDHYKNFEVNKTHWKNIPQLAKTMHSRGQKLITIVDAGFKADDPNYTYYKLGTQAKLFIRSAKNPDDFNGNLIGNVWPGKAAFVDFLDPNANNFWRNGLKNLHKLTSFDAIWIDMNEVTTFCAEECPNDDPKPPEAFVQTARNLKDDDDDDEEDWSPTGEIPLTHYSISLDAKHYGKTPEEEALHVEYNLHSLYGTYQARATYDYWLKGALQGKRPFVLSRSTFAGAGKWTSHWLGDNFATWEFMHASVAGIFDFNMFGMPLVGADVCGFHEPTTPELCGRWHQLAAFYPFARNHNNQTDENKPLPSQEPYTLEEPWDNTAKLAIIQRYSYLRYMYTRLYEINQNGGGTLIRPLFFEFPDDDNAYKGYEHTFMVGDALKVTPVLVPETKHNGKIKSYFPANSRFISLNNFKTVVEGGPQGQNLTLEASMEFTIVHLRQGHIIPFQNMTIDHYVMTTKELIQSEPLTLLVFPDKNGNAEGFVYIDEDGDDFIDVERNAFQYYKLRFNDRGLSIEKHEGDMSVGPANTGNQVIDKIVILDATKYKDATLTGCAYDYEFVPKSVEVEYDEDMNALVIQKLDRGALLFKEVMGIQFSDATDDTTFCNAKYVVTSKTASSSDGGEHVDRVELKISSGDKPHLPDLTAEFALIGEQYLRVQIFDQGTEEFEAPKDAFNKQFIDSLPPGAFDLSVILTLPEEGEEFYYEVSANGAKTPYYSTKGQQFVYSPYYKRHAAQIETTGQIFGLGERVGEFFLREGVYTMWNRDATSPIEDGLRPGNNIYGTHPVYFARVARNDFFGVYDHNFGAQDYVVKKAGKKYQITQIKTSGLTDQFVILKTDVQEVIGRYQEIVGKPAIVPEWALGWHQCRYGYNNTAQVSDVVAKFREHELPLDAMWTDIDYMEQYQDFTVSTTDFKDLPAAVADWKEQYNIKYVPILDGGIAYTPGQKGSAYERGLSKKVYIQDPVTAPEPFVGKVWPGPAVFIDWYHDDAHQYWIDEMKKLHDKLDFDGMWIDMNEASNFCNGHCTLDKVVENSVQKQLFYTPGGRDLDEKSISIDAKHVREITEFEAHSTYGFFMGKATSAYFTEEAERRQFIITRSSTSGSGKYVSKWLGDNFSTWEYLKYSVNGIFLFQFFGMPVVGADICGFIDDTNAKLCARWYALGAFYPFARNHNDKESVPQEPYVEMFNAAIAPEKTYTDFFREAALKRYALHRYHYSHVHENAITGVPYFTPVFYRYPEEKEAYNRVEQNIMLGESIKISPVVTNTTVKGSFYFPESGALWCPIWPMYAKGCVKGGTSILTFVPEDEILAHIKSGRIIVTQLGDFRSVPDGLNLESLKDVPVDLAIHPSSKYSAFGSVRYDDGETLDLDAYTQYEFTAEGASPFIGASHLDLNVTVTKSSSTETPRNNQNLGSIVVYNAGVLSLGKNSKCHIEFTNGATVDLTGEYNKDHNIMRFFVEKQGGEKLDTITKIKITSK